MATHIRSHRAPFSCFPKEVSVQLSSEQSVGDVGIKDDKKTPMKHALYRTNTTARPEAQTAVGKRVVI